ncbi:GNAT family N-acetyltransferase [Virgibacillus oceani]
MRANLKFIPFYKNDPDLNEIGELYCKIFLDNFSLKDKENALKNLNNHAGYEGFKGLKAIDSDGNITGFTYGYTSMPEQFYHQKIANQLSADEINTWLDNCFEFVELAVDPDNRRLGIASKLHGLLLENLYHKTSVLTTVVENDPAINLYRTKGWQVINSKAPVISEDNLQVIMGKRL